MEGTKHKIMVVGAHAGDAEIMAGALVAKYTQAGHEAVLVHLTPGEKGHRTMPPEEYAKQKIEEGHKAAEVLGAKAIFLPYKDAELPVNDEVKYRLADVIRAEKPTIMVTHWKGSIHKDHENTYYIVQDAIFYAALPAIKRELPAHGCYTQFLRKTGKIRTILKWIRTWILPMFMSSGLPQRSSMSCFAGPFPASGIWTITKPSCDAGCLAGCRMPWA